MAAAPPTTSEKWSSDSHQYLAVEYDDTFLVYFRPSGETHFLNFLSYGMVHAVSSGPLSEEEILARMRTDFSLTAEELPETLVATTLSELDQAGLITALDAGT